MRRNRNAKIVATLGPSSSTEDKIRALFVAGVDVFRLNFSHGTPEEHRTRCETARRVGREFGRPVGILADLQGPSCGWGALPAARCSWSPGPFSPGPGSVRGRCAAGQPAAPGDLPALVRDASLLLDDGRLQLKVESSARIMRSRAWWSAGA